MGTNGAVGCGDSIRQITAICQCPIRLELLFVLSRHPDDVSSISMMLKLDLPVVSYHLGQLRKAGLVTNTAIKQRRLYTLGRSVSIDVLDQTVCLTLRGKDGCNLALSMPISNMLIQHLMDESGPLAQGVIEPVNPRALNGNRTPAPVNRSDADRTQTDNVRSVTRPASARISSSDRRSQS